MAMQFVKWWRTKFHSTSTTTHHLQFKNSFGTYSAMPTSVLGGESDGGDLEEVLLGGDDESSSCSYGAHSNPALSINSSSSSSSSSTCSSQHNKTTVNLEDFECDVEVEGTESGEERKEFSFTFYDLDGHGKITKDDIAGLVRSIYGAVNDSITVPSGGKKTVRVRLTLSPQHTKSHLISPQQNNNLHNFNSKNSHNLTNHESSNKILHNSQNDPQITLSHSTSKNSPLIRAKNCQNLANSQNNPLNAKNSENCRSSQNESQSIKNCQNIRNDPLNAKNAENCQNLRNDPLTTKNCQNLRNDPLSTKNCQNVRNDPLNATNTENCQNSQNDPHIAKNIQNLANDPLNAKNTQNVQNIENNAENMRRRVNVSICEKLRRGGSGRFEEKEKEKRNKSKLERKFHSVRESDKISEEKIVNKVELLKSWRKRGRGREAVLSSLIQESMEKNNVVLQGNRRGKNHNLTKTYCSCAKTTCCLGVTSSPPLVPSPKILNLPSPPPHNSTPHSINLNKKINVSCARHRHREEEQQRAMAQVLQWLQRESLGLGDKKSDKKDDLGGWRGELLGEKYQHVHEHIHHHYHHHHHFNAPKETPIIV